MSSSSRRTPPNRISRLLLWCAGSDLQLLQRLPPSESVKQLGYGTLVVVPAVLAAFSMTYALSTLTEQRAIYVAGGLLWAAIVFCFDRFIVSTFRKSASAIDDVTSLVFVSRLLFAAFVGVLVAHPLVMLYFDDSIEDQLSRQESARASEIEVSFEERSLAAAATIEGLEAEIREREVERNGYQGQLVAEIDGVVSGRTTGIPGRGASAAEKKLQLEVAQRELGAVRERNLARVATLSRELDELREEGRERAAAYRQPRDYLARVGALEALAEASPHVDRVKWFLILFFVFVDTLPIAFKGLTPRGPYDDALQLGELAAAHSLEVERKALESDRERFQSPLAWQERPGGGGARAT